MAAGYTRQAAANIAAGLTIQSADLNAEFNQVQTAFDITTGHDHSGSSAGTGAKIVLTSSVSGILPIANGGTASSSTTYCSLTTNVTGTLPVANGGTGVTTSTGTGSNVLSASPTLTGTLTAATITATTYQVGGVALSASNLSNGVTGSGAVMLAASPTTTGTLSTAAIATTGAITIPNAVAFNIKNAAGVAKQTLAADASDILYIDSFGTMLLRTNNQSRSAITLNLTGNVQFNQYGAGSLYTDGSGNLAAAGANTVSASGILKLADGVVMQWGNAAVNGTTAVSFNAAFSTAVYNVQVCGQAGLYENVGSVTTSGFNIVPSGAGAHNVYWFAIGK